MSRLAAAAAAAADPSAPGPRHLPYIQPLMGSQQAAFAPFSQVWRGLDACVWLARGAAARRTCLSTQRPLAAVSPARHTQRSQLDNIQLTQPQMSQPQLTQPEEEYGAMGEYGHAAAPYDAAVGSAPQPSAAAEACGGGTAVLPSQPEVTRQQRPAPAQVGAVLGRLERLPSRWVLGAGACNPHSSPLAPLVVQAAAKLLAMIEQHKAAVMPGGGRASEELEAQLGAIRCAPEALDPRLLGAQRHQPFHCPDPT